MKTFAILRTNNKIEICSVDPEKEYDFLSGAVGGYIEAVHISDSLVMWVNEEGKLENLPVNYLGTGLWEARFGRTDVIVGDVVLTGGVDEEGYSKSLSAGHLEMFSELA